MTTLQTRPVTLDESAQELIRTFLSHVAAVVGYGRNRSVTIARAKALLSAALGDGDGASSDAWGSLYHAIAEIVKANGTRDATSSHAFLQSFIQDNGDLADA